ncbi:MAG: DUF2817 domain-containing protein [Candidatus Cloacimonetes bacterium]|nr:DUF2817 domain-containing protein [Candidatus Cloacimonadota bacterium]
MRPAISLLAILAFQAIAMATVPFGNRTPFSVDTLSPAQLQELALARVDVDHWNGGAWTLWLSPEEQSDLIARGYALTSIPNPVEEAWREWISRPADPLRDNLTYRTYTELTTELQGWASSHPEICQLYSIGTSVQGRELWVLNISDNPGMDEDEPEIKLVSTMHGDEVVGTVLLLNLIEDLIEGYGTDTRLSRIVDEMDLHVLVLMNPDGMQSGSRYNAHGVDLNRNFPDRIDDPVNTTAGREPETAAVMQWTWDHDFDLSCNYHGGAVVANYGWDGNLSGQDVYTIAPDDELFIDLALTYSSQYPTMYNSLAFDQGITNGADWYVIYGGMQDWCYLWEGGVDITLEVSQVKWPSENTLPGFWNSNRESMLRFVEYGLKGIRGIVRDADSQLPVEATVRLQGIDSNTFSSAGLGDYHRLCVPGTYTLEVSAPGYAPAVVSGISVGSGDATVVDVELQFIGLPQQILLDDFSADGGWTLQGLWAIGAAIVGGGEHGNPDPATDTSPGTDNQLLGYAIGGDYENSLGSTFWATSPVWDLSGWQQVQLDFNRFLGLERNLYDHGYLQAYNGSAWITLWENGSTSITDAGWNPQVFDLSAIADGNSQFQLRFGMGRTDSAWRYCGWNVDDLTLSGYPVAGPLVSPALNILVNGTSVQLSWNAVPGASSYRIDAALEPGEAFLPLTSTVNTQLSLPGELSNWPRRVYRVVALNDAAIMPRVPQAATVN